MKRSIGITLAIAMALFFVGCGGGDGEKNESANVGNETPADINDAMVKYAQIVKFNEMKDVKDIKKATEAAGAALTSWEALQKGFPSEGPGIYANYSGWGNSVGGIVSKMSELKTALEGGDDKAAFGLCLDVEDFIVAMHRDLQMMTALERVMELRHLLYDLEVKEGDEKKMVVTQMNDMAAKLSEGELPLPPKAVGIETEHKELLESIVENERNMAEAGDNKEAWLSGKEKLFNECARYIVEFM